MNEREAWLKIAEMFDGPKTEKTKNGLCYAVEGLLRSEDNTMYLYYQMQDRIERYMDCDETKWGLYIWPPKEEYRKNRADLARQFAEECK